MRVGRAVRRLLIILALASCSPVREPRVVWACTATHECDGPPITESFEMCGTDDEVEKNESGWAYACQDAAGVYGCGAWECAESCAPTARRCGGSDTSLP